LPSGVAPADEQLYAPRPGVLVGYPLHHRAKLRERRHELIPPAIIEPDHASHCESGS